MILLITTSFRGQECAGAVQSATGHPTHFAPNLQDAFGKLRVQEYLAIIFDQFLMETEPDPAEQILQHFGGAVPIFVNFAISGIERVVREVRVALRRREQEEHAARQAAERALWSEMKQSVTALLMSCELAMATPGVPPSALEKLQTMRDLTSQLKTRLVGSESC